MSSTRGDQTRIKIFKVLIAYLFIQMFILALDRNMYKTDEANFSAKTGNFTVTGENIRKITNSKLVSSPALKRSVQKPSHVYCNGEYKVYNNNFVILSSVVLDTKKCTGIRKGGEHFSDVLNQNESHEYCDANSGFFQLGCDRKPFHSYSNKGHFNQWDASIEIVNRNLSKNYTERNVTFGIIRKDYANLYWVLVDIYDIYHVTRLLDMELNNVEILLVDMHPSTPLDNLWSNLFRKVSRVGHLTEKVLYRDFIWGMCYSDSPLLKRQQTTTPFLLEFRHFVLSKLNLISKSSGLNCKNITITIVFRRDYIAHARNPSGKINRKMSNDLELLKNISGMFKGHNVIGVQLDLLPIEEQIQLASTTDILVGMHGAGLSHVLFLPSHAALIELFPLNFSVLSHFQFIAKWRKLSYTRWKNNDRRREIYPDSTTIDVLAIASIIDKVYKKKCMI